MSKRQTIDPLAHYKSRLRRLRTAIRDAGCDALLITNPLRKAEDRRPVPESMRAWFRLGPAVLVGMVASLLVHGAPLVGSR